MKTVDEAPSRPAGRVLHVAGLLANGLLTVLATFVVTTLFWLTMWMLAPRAVGWDTVVITSGSMQPLVSVGDAVVIQHGTDRLAPGYLVTFHDPAQPGRVLTHRLVSYNTKGELITKGDANEANDSMPVPKSSVIGTARVIIPMAGLPTYWHLSRQYAPLGALGFAAICSLLLLAVTGRQSGLDLEPDPEPEPKRGRRRRGRATSHPDAGTTDATAEPLAAAADVEEVGLLLPRQSSAGVEDEALSAPESLEAVAPERSTTS